ncbi:MAG: hypothetical protein ABFD79_10630 [Phycisphaerales bacterium]
MTNEEAISKLQDILNDIPRLKNLNIEHEELEIWHEKINILIRAIFVDDYKERIASFQKIYLYNVYAKLGKGDVCATFNAYLDTAEIKLKKMIDELELLEPTTKNSTSPNSQQVVINGNNNVVANGDIAINNVLQENQKNKTPWYKKAWAIISGITILLGGILTIIQIYESKTFSEGLLEKKENYIMAETIDYNNWITPLNVRTHKRIDDLYKKIENEKLNPWLFINAGLKVELTRFDGKIISCQGVLFEGSPRLVFWSDDFIPPFIEDTIKKVFDQTLEECRANNLHPQRYLYETKCLLMGFVGKVYNRMAEIDYELMKKNSEKKIKFRDVILENKKMDELIEKYYQAAILLGTKKNDVNVSR